MDGIRGSLCVVLLAMGALTINQADAQPAMAPAVPAYPNVILITLDTTRADRMGFLGSKRGLTPNLDALARQSTVFTHAYSQAPLTPTSHSTILTGTYPQYHQVLTFPIPLGKDMPYMPDILKAHGYSTAAFVGSLALDPTWGVPGFERGFDTYDAGYSWQGYTPKTRYQTTERRGSEVVARALAWLSGHQQGPFFLWVHLFDPHEPYDPPEPYKTRYAKALYDGEIAYVDSVMGKFLTELKSRGLYDGALIALTADHGESLGAHGEDTHGIFLYDETIHVPLVIKLPRGAATGKEIADGVAGRIAGRIDDRVELADIMPTLLQTVGIPVPEKVQGQSLLGFVEPGTTEGDAAAKVWHDRGAYSQADYGHLAFAWSAEQSLRSGKYLYIQAPRRELYDDGVDANAQHNLAPASPAVADTLSAAMAEFRQKTTNLQQTPKAALDEARVNKLAALGYMASRSDTSMAASTEQGADPKDKIAIANTVLRINNILQDFRCDKAMPELRKALVTAPSISMLHFFMGGCYLEKEDYQEAVPELRKAVQLDPGFTHAEMNLGRALMAVKDYSAAATAFEDVIKTDPQLMDSHVFLVVAYARLNRVPEEIRECRFVLQSIPEHFGSNLNLGRFLAKSGDNQGAIPSLQKAASLRPESPIPHIYLEEVYAHLGRQDDAKRERAEAERLGAIPKGPVDDAPDAPRSNPE
jgi:arylsulfatase A-like enzyme/Tfp pilus assembly protein PilF